jgi:hypothetical protein
MKAFWQAHKLGVIIAASLALVAALYLGGNTVRRVGNWAFHRGVTKDEQSIQADKTALEQTKLLLHDALRDLEQTKAAYEHEKTVTDDLKKVLADKSLNTQEKLKAYEDIKNTPLPPARVDPTTAELCARAKAITGEDACAPAQQQPQQ